MNWIKCSDRLPKEGSLVLIYRESDTIPNMYFIDIGAYGFFNSYIWGNKKEDNWNVTHWMPLPKPPEND